jgi:hypothetical protein
MLNTRNPNFPKTSETCKLLKNGIISSIETKELFGQALANEKLELLKKNRCKKVLLWVHETYKNDPSPFVQQIAKKALDYARSL